MTLHHTTNSTDSVDKFHIPCHSPDLTDLEERRLLEAFRSGWISSKGPHVKTFEVALAGYFGRRHSLAVSSGTAALHLSLIALGVGPGDEVIVPDLTYIAVANAVLYCGATPVVSDVQSDSWCMDPLSVASLVTRKTKAIIAVHGFGHPLDLDPVLSIAKAAGIPVIEDVSQAFGARYRGKLIGTAGDISVHSFFANKIITTGEGGAIVTDNEELNDKIALLRNHCESPLRKYLHSAIGFSYRMTSLQAALGLSQLSRIQEILAKRQRLLSDYRGMLKEIPDIVVNPACDWATPVNWMVCLNIGPRIPSSTDAQKWFQNSGIEVRPAFLPLSLQPSLSGRITKPETPVSHGLYSKILMLPSGSNLEQNEIADVCNKICAGYGR